MVEITKATTSSPTSSVNVTLLQTDDENQSKSNQPIKKRRNLPGMPDPDAEVIALSPKSLLTPNRFVCEVCNKGFQRDQNLQLHRRGHNLPWKLRQRTSIEVRKRVYVCPEPSCVHHDPSRALGDLTGIKKHFSRKHGEKKLKCDKCAKKYAVKSDWKAHMKTCGTKEYRCDCGILFSRRDSFITHRAFCDVLAQETARSQPPLTIPTSSGENSKLPMMDPVAATSGPPSPPLTPSTGVLHIQNSDAAEALDENQATQIQQATVPTPIITTSAIPTTSTITITATSAPADNFLQNNPITASTNPHTTYIVDPVSLSLSSSLYATPSLLHRRLFYVSGPQPALSATALLQKAAQLGPTSSFLCGLGTTTNDDLSSNNAYASTMATITTTNWSENALKLENNSMTFGLELGLPPSGLNEFMMGQPSMFGNKPATLDFLGLGLTGAAGEAFLDSVSRGLDFSGGETWNGAPETKSSML